MRNLLDSMRQTQQRIYRICQGRSTWFAILLSLLASALVISGPQTIAWGQISSPNPTEILSSPLRQLENRLPVLGDLLDTAEITRGVVRLDGRRLFTIAVPALQDQADSQEDSASLQSRVEIIERRLQQIVDRGFDPESLEITTETDSSSGQPVIYVSYRRDGESNYDQLLTVTALDAQINGTNPSAWAEEISAIVEDALLSAQQERQPQFFQQQVWWAGGILLTTVIGSLLLSLWQRYLRAKRKKLSVQSHSEQTDLSVAANPETSPEITTVLLQRQALVQQKRRFNDIQWRLSQLAQLLLWGIGLFVVFGLFPYTRWLQPVMVQWVQIPIRLLMVVLMIYLAIRFSEVIIDRLFWALQSSTSLATNTSQRLMLRFTTFSRVTKSIAVLVWGSVGIIVALSTLGISISPALLTLAGVVGVGISLASQNLIKDVINGFLILLEDQYGVGDVVKIGEMSGFVENMNLRITQLRSNEGQLITIPNSAISVVQNLSKEWSRVDLGVSVAYEADLDQALAVTEQVAQAMSRDPEWQELILEPPQVLGVDNLDYAGATIRLWIKTQPLKQWEVAREYRRRLKIAFDQAGIPIGIPQQSLWLSNVVGDGDSQLPRSPQAMTGKGKG
ncbi:MAG: mechanosensitive ion channel family protein [Leptolyngbya sp. IPPAS B-1204]|nr:MAG: mechanosensitive ion channel family protein [Leptolyngbya sp. IPPAS B-1204]